MSSDIGNIITYTGSKPEWIQAPDMPTLNFLKVLYKLDLCDDAPKVHYWIHIGHTVMHPMHNTVIKCFV